MIIALSVLNKKTFLRDDLNLEFFAIAFLAVFWTVNILKI